jgi:acyl carrier protein
MTMQPERESVDEQAVRRWLCQQIARTSDMPIEKVDTSASFAYFGLNSLQYVDLIVRLETWLGREVPPTAAYDFPTIDLLARYVAQALDEPLPHAVSPEAWT